MTMLGVWWLLVWLMRVLRTDRCRRRRRRTPTPTLIAATATTHPRNQRNQRNQRKPEWAITEVLRLKALSPDLGCRTIAEIFNRRHGSERRITISKSFVADILRKHKAELRRLRRDFKHHVPPPMANNRVWGLDLTGKGDLTGRQRFVLGLIDHGSRACLRLHATADKSSPTILRHLVDAIRQFGLLKAIRTDNEACFTSRTMR